MVAVRLGRESTAEGIYNQRFFHEHGADSAHILLTGFLSQGRALGGFQLSAVAASNEGLTHHTGSDVYHSRRKPRKKSEGETHWCRLYLRLQRIEVPAERLLDKHRR